MCLQHRPPRCPSPGSRQLSRALLARRVWPPLLNDRIKDLQKSSSFSPSSTFPTWSPPCSLRQRPAPRCCGPGVSALRRPVPCAPREPHRPRSPAPHGTRSAPGPRAVGRVGPRDLAGSENYPSSSRRGRTVVPQPQHKAQQLLALAGPGWAGGRINVHPINPRRAVAGCRATAPRLSPPLPVCECASVSVGVCCL